MDQSTLNPNDYRAPERGLREAIHRHLCPYFGQGYDSMHTGELDALHALVPETIQTMLDEGIIEKAEDMAFEVTQTSEHLGRVTFYQHKRAKVDSQAAYAYADTPYTGQDRIEPPQEALGM